MSRLRMMATASALVVVTASIFAYVNGPVVYSGQGLSAAPGGGLTLSSEVCGIENGAEVDGAYLLWVFTATQAPHADITFNPTAAALPPDAGTHQMFRQGNQTSGAFKYVSQFHNLNDLIGNVQSTYDGNLKNAQLVISHGCRDICADTNLSIERGTYIPPFGGLQRGTIIVHFLLGPVTINWGDGSPVETAINGTLTTHDYHQGPTPVIVTITVTTRDGCVASVPFEVEGTSVH